MWLGIADTTLDEFAHRRREIQQLLDEVVPRASVIQQAVETTDEAHADAQRTEYERRRTLMSEINKDLRREREQEDGGRTGSDDDREVDLPPTDAVS
jgi:hypothetical protein